MEEKKNLWSRKKLLVKRSDIIFMILILFIASLRHMEIIKFGITWIVAILLFIYWFLSLSYFAKAETEEIKKSAEKFIYMDKNDRKQQIKKSNKVFIDRLILIFVFMVFALAIIMIDKNVSTKVFLRTAEETVGVVLDVEKYIEKERESDGDGGYEIKYNAEFVYKIFYEVNNEEYFYSYSMKGDYSSRGAAENAKASYNVNDQLKIYYQIDNPEEVRVNIEIFPAKIIYILLDITFGIELIWLLVLKKNYDKDCENNTVSL